jgi:transcriptional regulator with XRE-family HTH domain
MHVKKTGFCLNPIFLGQVSKNLCNILHNLWDNLGMNLREIGLKVGQRRVDLGLSQDRLAKLCGLSRSTIHHLEKGTLRDLGAAKLFSLLSLLGLDVITQEHRKKHHGLDMASKTASVSYKTLLKSSDLSRSLASGTLPRSIYPHVATLIDEAPLEIIVSAVEEAASVNQVAPKAIWKNIHRWAHEMQSPRLVWA